MFKKFIKLYFARSLFLTFLGIGLFRYSYKNILRIFYYSVLKYQIVINQCILYYFAWSL